ncbi:hypothetical protein AVEN_151962-1 [Araneus ventricosus]|uniref:Uncharacterized protein n=1 Tax=Araneus ventricosus TaxID=182803 RepID=A0A4Y2FWS2_ARAVE|nr:hypothetical protein AVEN_151962-1 [Araneus ventricosus]
MDPKKSRKNTFNMLIPLSKKKLFKTSKNQVVTTAKKRKIPSEEVPPKLFEMLEDSAEYPPLFSKCMTGMFVAYKAKDYHHYPSDLIGANFRGGSQIPNPRTIHKLRLLPSRSSSTTRNIL